MWRANSNLCGYLWKLHSVAFPELFGVSPHPQSGGFFIIIQKHNWVF